MDNLTVSGHYRKNNRGVDTQSTIINSINVSSTPDLTTSTIETESNDQTTRSKILPPKNCLRRMNLTPTAPSNDLKDEIHENLSNYPEIPSSESYMTNFLELSDEIKTELLTTDDKSLRKNMIDPCGRIVFPIKDLKELIRIATRRHDVEFIIDDRVISDGCCKVKNKLQKRIEKIVVDGTDFEIAFNQIFTMMEMKKISLDYTYIV